MNLEKNVLGRLSACFASVSLSAYLILPEVAYFNKKLSLISFDTYIDIIKNPTKEHILLSLAMGAYSASGILSGHHH